MDKISCIKSSFDDDQFLLNLHNDKSNQPPELGSVIFDGSTKEFKIYDGNSWKLIAGATVDKIEFNTNNDDSFIELTNLLDQLPINQLQNIYANKDNLMIELERLVLSKV